MAGPATSTSERLLDAAEELIAEHGPDAVSTRQILTAAGVGNMAAIQYHFRTKEGLLAAVVARVLEPLERERAAELAALRQRGECALEEVCVAYVRPMVRLRTAEHGHRAAKVMGRVLGQPREFLQQIGVTDTDDTDTGFAEEFAAHLPALTEQERYLRLQSALAVVVFYALGYTEHPGHRAAGADDDVRRLARVIAALLAAPPADERRRERGPSGP